MVMMNKPTHQRGSGLFISRRSPSQTWPVVLSLAVMALALPLNHNKSRQAMMLTSVMPATYKCQKLLMKSLMEIPWYFFNFWRTAQSSWRNGSWAASSKLAWLRRDQAHTTMPIKQQKASKVTMDLRMLMSMTIPYLRWVPSTCR